MQSFVVFISFVILLTNEVHSWRILGKNTTEAPTSTTPICNCNLDSSDDPRDPNFEPLITSSGNIPKVWQLEAIMTVDEVEALTNKNYVKIREYYEDRSHWRLQPFGKDINSPKLQALPRVVLLETKLRCEESILARRHKTVLITTCLEVSGPGLDNVYQTFDHPSSVAMKYVKIDTNWPVAHDIHNGKNRTIFNVVPVEIRLTKLI